ncbi:uncharacterized protein PFL1_00379 [Pseudozyma flocculosa PF-1]|uniref:Uncharacterized protein n=1 Tax=Pseudozyma flocculosa TaxID=84751 RepID=A0A5C3ETM0_9BASI|nr:uncharacterized protein PFL1_00379 [Pseudozyma flocculosa PF-1]EPQ32182.1 hypothetical protein PFL1_00379 [Pseudozyma flocculosa PF-1]SPO34876.1 uncharacterized protein PSFLO_00347 [Pseudozyma flocculosa]
MVLQNKYKARASRRYNNTKGESTQHGEPPQKPGFRQRHFRRFGSQLGPSGKDDGHDDGEGSNSGSEEDHSGSDQEDGGDSDDDDDGDDEVHDPRFPSLEKAAAAGQASSKQQGKATTDGDKTAPPSGRGKFSRRKLGESNAARIARLEAEKDPHLEGSDDEPEIDISALVARVKALDPNAHTQAGVSADIAAHRAERETASDVENDIDHSLAWLHEREMQRQKAKGRAGWKDGRPDAKRSDSHAEMKDVDLEGNKIDYEAIKREKEKAEALRALKARFQGRALGERESKAARARPVPSIKIGPHRDQPLSGSMAPTSTSVNGGLDPASSGRRAAPAVSPPASSTSSRGSSSAMSASSSLSSPSGAQRHDETSAVSDSVAAEIDASLNRQRKLAQSGNHDSGSVSSQRSSFSTDFGRRRSPMSVKDYDGVTDPGPPTDEIDSFLASLKPEPLVRTSQQVRPGSPEEKKKRHGGGKGGDRAASARTPLASSTPSPEKAASKGERIHRFPVPAPALAAAGPLNSKMPKRGEIESLESFLDDMLK